MFNTVYKRVCPHRNNDPDSYPNDIWDGMLRFFRIDDMQPTDALLEGGEYDFASGKQSIVKPWVESEVNSRKCGAFNVLKWRAKAMTNGSSFLR